MECKGVGLTSLVSCSCSVAVVLSVLVLRSAWLVPCSSFLAACSFWATVSGEKRWQGMGWITRLGWSLFYFSLLSWIGVFLYIMLFIVGFNICWRFTRFRSFPFTSSIPSYKLDILEACTWMINTFLMKYFYSVKDSFFSYVQRKHKKKRPQILHPIPKASTPFWKFLYHPI